MIQTKTRKLPVSISAVVIIRDEQGRILLLQQASQEKGYKWGPPAGKMQAFENPIETIKREVKEETGVEVELTGVIGVYTIKRGPAETSMTFAFRGKLKEEEIKPNPKEIKDFRYFSEQEIEQLTQKDKLYKPEFNIRVIKDALEEKTYPVQLIKL